MAKAFNSVSLVPLNRTMERIKIPCNMRRFITNLFHQRQIRIITKYDISELFTSENGIDQGETISLLLWRIFYDPLLCRIQDDLTLGITTSLKWPTKSHHVFTHITKIRSVTSAYADNTI